MAWARREDGGVELGEEKYVNKCFRSSFKR